MYLTRHATTDGARWALDGHFLPRQWSLALLLTLPQRVCGDVLRACVSEELADGSLLPPIEPDHEVWASGVTYRRSRDARKAESQVADVYERVYDAARPVLFFKTIHATT